ncbi:MAG: kelch repeat-containing protein [Caldilineaceae bacterium]
MFKRIFIFLLFGFVLAGGAEQRGIPILAPETFRHPVEENAPGTWVQVSTLPTARSEMPVAVSDGKFYVPGGFLGLRTLEAYDPTANQWTSLAAMPQGRHHAMSTGYDGKVYVFGGAYNTSWVPTNTTWIYDPTTDTTGRSRRPCQRRACRAALV